MVLVGVVFYFLCYNGLCGFLYAEGVATHDFK